MSKDFKGIIQNKYPLHIPKEYKRGYTLATEHDKMKFARKKNWIIIN
jgi:hypothetical protein